MATLNLKEMKWIDENALRIIISTGLGFASRVQALENKEIEEFTADKLYEKGSKVLHNNYLWIAKVTNQSSTFNEKYWDKIGDDITELDLDEIKGFLGLTQEQLNTLASIILDNEIRLDKTWSSSKSHTEIQEILKEAKQYCLTELAKKSTGSFKKANSTSEVTDGNYLYLILNSSTNKYDIYALVDSNVELLTSVDVNLDDYYTKTEINNDFLKKTDATSTYATKTEANDKVDKTSIKTAISNTPSDNNLLSEKYIDENIVKKSDITTTIDSSSTDTQIPSAKAVYDKYSLHDLAEASTNIINDALRVDTQNQYSVVNKDCLVTSSSSIQAPNDLLWGIRQVFWHANSDLVLKITGKDINNKSCIWINSLTLKDGSYYWQGWLKNATTSVADVPKTLITISNETNYKNSATCESFYIVKNGTCFVTLVLDCVSPLNNVAIGNLPSSYGVIRFSMAHVDGAINGYILPSGVLKVSGGNANTKYYVVSFSYPVAES